MSSKNQNAAVGCAAIILMPMLFCGLCGGIASTLDPERTVVESPEQSAAEPDTTDPAPQPAAPPKPTQAEAFAAIQELIEPSALIHSTAISKGGIAVVVVENGWHYEPKQIRLQIATAIGQRWKEADPEGLGAITFVAIGGNEIGGRGFRGIWVTD